MGMWRMILLPLIPMAAGGSFTTADLYAPALDALGLTESRYTGLFPV
jgi:hypothetical protein